MKTLLKVIAWALGGLLVLVVGLVAAVALFVDPNDFKDDIADAVRNATGRELSIDGDLELSFYPWLGLSTGALSLTDREGFGDEPMIEVAGAAVRAKLLPLLRREVQIDTIVLEAPRLRMRVNENGDTNWADLTGGGDAGQTANGGAGQGMAGLTLAGLQIKDGDVLWDDRPVGQQYHVRNLNLTTGDILAARPVPVELSFEMSGAQLPTDLGVDLAAMLTANLAAQRVEIAGLNLAASGDAINASLEVPEFSLDAASGIITGANAVLTISQDGVDVKATAGSFEMDLNGQRVRLGELSAALSGQVSDATGPLSAEATVNAVQFDMSTQQVQLDGLSAALSGSVSEATGPLSADVTLGGVQFDLNTQQGRLDGLSASLSGRVSEAAGPLSAEATVGGAQFDLGSRQVQLDGLSATLSGSVSEAGGPLSAEASVSDVQFDMGSQVVQLAELKATVSAILDESQGPVNAVATIAATRFDLAASSGTLGPLDLLVELDGKTTTAHAVQANVDLNGQTASIPEITFEHGDLRARVGITASGFLDAPSVSGTLSTDPFDLRQLAQDFGVALDGIAADALHSASVASSFTASAEQAELRDLALVLDETRVSGRLAIADFSRPAYRFDLDIDRLDLDALLADTAAAPEEEAGWGSASAEGAAEAGKTPAAGADGAPQPATDIPVALLRELDADGSLAIGALRVSGINLSAVKLKLLAKDGRVSLDPVAARLYSGSLNAAVGIDVTGATPVVTLRNRFESIDVGQVLKDGEISDKLAATGSLSIDLTAQGATDEELLRSNQGKLKFELRDGAIRGFNLRKIILDAQDLIRKLQGDQTAIDTNADDETQFTELRGTIDVNNGVASNQDLGLKAPLFRVGGEGSANVVQDTVDYLLQVTVVDTAEGQGGRALEELDGVTIPVRARGPLADPGFSVDVAALVQARVDRELDQQKAKLEAKARKKLEDQLAKQQSELDEKVGSEVKKLGDKLLKGLFN